jgi:hypothetical protein
MDTLVDWWLVTDIWRQLISIIFTGLFNCLPLEDGPQGCHETPVTNHQSTLRYIPEEVKTTTTYFPYTVILKTPSTSVTTILQVLSCYTHLFCLLH